MDGMRSTPDPKCLAVHPVKTQIISSGFIWGVGDIAAQTISHCTLNKHPQNSAADEEFKINWKRVATTSMLGFGFVGPVGHFWILTEKGGNILKKPVGRNHFFIRKRNALGLDHFIRLRLQLQPNSVRFVAAKVAIDEIISGPLDLFTYMGFSTGKNAAQVKEDVKRDFLPALILEGGVWPIVQVANFRFIPVRYQLLYVNVFCLLDSAFLSWFEQQQDAPWKQWFASFLALKEQEGQGR
ncbi:hypothetical protein HHK36_021616 [Tetracentron sinense]|uniref:Uncharacterized protein n=1 Tax=Tetracentron sinense TaxID=13715 RepID=A0A835D7J0_TETSI|nr:hypothetical protein HHK36_021616 [Tetracentron sinense]